MIPITLGSLFLCNTSEGVYAHDMLLRNLTLAFVLTCTASYAQESWVVSPDEAVCLFENIDAYLESGDEPVVIFVRLCPVADAAEALRRMQQNSGAVPAAPSVTIAPDGSEFDEYIVYSREELTCLKDIVLDGPASPVRLPQKPCD